MATVVSLPLGALISSLASWRVAFLLGAALGAVALVGQLVLLPRLPPGSVIGGAAVGAGELAFDFSLAGCIAAVGAILLPVLGRRRSGERMPAAQVEAAVA